MRWTREAYLDLMTFGQAARPMFSELFGPLVGLEEEWRTQGATPQELDLTAFDWDWVPVVGCGGQTGPISGLAREVVREDDEAIIERDELGRTTRRYKRISTIAHPLDFPVRDMDSWLAVKPWFAFGEGRVDPVAIEAARRAQVEGAMVVAGIPGAFDTPRRLMGEEAACLACYDQPELIHDILGTLADTAVRVLERVTDRIRVDQLSVHEDFAGKSGPMHGPRQIRELWRPYYRAAWDLVSSRGTPLFRLDSDGDIAPVLDELLACGVNVIEPVEPVGGMDPLTVRERYGRRLAMKGGIDKFVLQRGREAIRRELERTIRSPLAEGGTVFALDHRIPNGTPLDAYRLYVDLGREILGLAPRSEASRGWARMAF